MLAARSALLFLLVLLVLVLGWSSEALQAVKVRKTLQAVKVRKRAWRTRSCADLPEEILEQMFGRLSVGVLNAFHHTLQLVPGPQNLSCPKPGRLSPEQAVRTPVNLLSLSPWAYRLSHDPGRYPRFLPEAYCLCRGCLLGPDGEESEQHRSLPVYIPTAVLTRSGSCVAGRHSYTETYLSVPVGCTCVPVLQDSKNPNTTRTHQNLTNSKNLHTSRTNSKNINTKHNQDKPKPDKQQQPKH